MQTKRFEHVVKGADFHGVDRGLNRALPGHDQGDQMRIDFERGPQQRDSVHLRHHQIAEHQIEVLFAQSLERVMTIGKSMHFE